MSSRKKSDSARINGAKSKGPVTPEGRARSSQNALRHGLSAAVVVLPHEDRNQFEQLRDSYMESFQPVDQPQHDLIETMAAARWRLNRLQEIEANLFEKEMVLRASEMAKELKEMTEGEKLAWVFDRMANQGKSLAMQIRYEGQLNRSYERAFKQLQQLQSKQQNEPTPEPGPSLPPPTPPPPTVAQALVPAAPALMPAPAPEKTPRPTPPEPPATDPAPDLPRESPD